MPINLPMILKQLRCEKNIGQKEIADYLDVDRSTYTKYETGQNSPDYEKLDKLANYFQVSTDYLLGKSPFKDNKEAEHSIRVAAMKAALNDPKYHDFIWSHALENAETGFGFTDRTMQYIKSLPTKKDLTDIDYYDLSRFVAWEIDYPIDFDGPATLILWETKILCDVDYWSIPRIVVEEQQSQIEYEEPVYDGPTSTPEEDFFDEEPTPTLSPREERDIARDLEKMLSNLESKEALAFNGELLDDETKELMRISLESSMRMGKQIAKQKFTPKKYKK